MYKRGQGSGVLVLIIVLVVVVAFLYFEGYISFPVGGTPGQGTHSSPIPISVSGSLSSTTIYANQNFSFITQISNSWAVPVTVSAIPYGCQFITATPKTASVFPNASSTLSWSFLSTSRTSCQIQVTACFNATSHAYYPFTIKNSTFTGAVPTASPVFNVAPLNISLSGFSEIFSASPTAHNQTLYLSVNAASSEGQVKNGTLKWLNIAVNGNAPMSIQLLSGYEGPLFNSNINITESGANAAFIQFGSINVPIYLRIPNNTPQSGFYGGNDLNITAAYTYCITSSPTQVSIQ